MTDYVWVTATASTLARPPLHNTFRSRAERLAAVGRFVLAGLTLLAIWIDPSEPSKYAGTAYALLVTYVGYAAVMAVLVWLSRDGLAPFAIAALVIDLLFAVAFMYLTEGPNSPFFSYFFFAIVSATLRWDWRGALWVSLVVLALFNGMGLYAGMVLHDPGFELNRFLIRSVYLGVMGVLLGYIGAYQARLRSELGGLVAWPREASADLETLLASDLAQAARVLGVPRVVAVWDDPEEPAVRLASWFQGALSLWREAADACKPWVAPALADAAFLCADAESPVPVVWQTAGAGVTTWRGAPLNPALTARLAARAVLSAPIRAGGVRGRLFALDRPRLTAEHVLLSGVVVRQIGMSLEHYYLTRQLRRAAAAEERVRLSRDLHDGVLQSLTGAALQLRTAEKLLDRDPAAARGVLRAVRELIADEQRDLRFFVQELKPGAATPVEDRGGLEQAMRELSRRLENVWGLRMDLDLAPFQRPVPEALLHEVFRLLTEAAVNAARHGRASALHVSLSQGADGIDLVIADNGMGFPFTGRLGHAALAAQSVGPRSLRERVDALGGTMEIESGAAGARLEIRMPLPAA